MTSRYFIHPENKRFWSVTQEGATILTNHGLLGGSIVPTSETFLGKNQGKANELTPEADAKSRMEYAVSKKKREGYQEFLKKGAEFHPLGDAPVKLSDSDLDFDALPESLCFYKPHNDVVGPLLKLMEAGKAWYSVKRNGMAYIAAKGPTGVVQIYSRRMFPKHDKELTTNYTWNDRMPWLVAELDEVMPCNSILTGELVIQDKDGKDQFKKVQKVVKSLTPEALELQKDDQDKVRFYVWDVPFWQGKNMMTDTTTEGRYDLIRSNTIGYKHLITIQYFTSETFKTPAVATEYAKKHELEGFVVVDPKGIYGEDGFNFKGKPDRPRKYCGKLKPTYEDDFIVDWNPALGIGNASTKDKFANGKPGIKSVALYQFRPDGKKIYICDLGVGLDDKMRVGLADPKLFPQVWAVSYKDRRYLGDEEDSNAIDFGSFERVRWTNKDGGDKDPSECVNDRI